MNEITRVADQTTFNGVQILDGSTTTLSIQVGTESGEVITVSFDNVQAASLGVNTDITTVTNAQAALDLIDTAIDTVTDLPVATWVRSRTASGARSGASPTRQRTWPPRRAASVTSTWPRRRPT